MKKLFTLIALAGLAAFQVGCGSEADKKPPMTAPAALPGGAGGPAAGAPGGMTGMPAAGAPTKEGEEAKKEDAATEDEKADAAPADGDKKEGEEPKKDE